MREPLYEGGAKRNRGRKAFKEERRMGANGKRSRAQRERTTADLLNDLYLLMDKPLEKSGAARGFVWAPGFRWVHLPICIILAPSKPLKFVEEAVLYAPIFSV